jgi:hypothetical protein
MRGALLAFLVLGCSPGDDTMGAPDASEAATFDAPEEPAPSMCDLASAPTVTTALSITTGRYAPGSALLPGGQVMLAGGYDFATGATNTTEIVDPVAQTTTPSTKLSDARNFLASALLGDGSLLVAGGFDPSRGSVTNTDLYAGGSFAKTGLMTTGREAHVATVLGDGRVLVTGGLQSVGFTFYDTAEIYDPSMSTFAKVTATLTVARAFHVAAWMGDHVVLVGGATGPSSETGSAEVFDPQAGTFTALATALTHAGKALAGARLGDGRLLVAGGSNETDKTLAAASIYDPTMRALASVSAMNVRRMAFSLTTLADGRVLAVGGWSDTEMPSSSTAQLEVCDPVANTWTLLPVHLSVPRHDHVAFLLPDCRVAILGGQSVMPNMNPVAPREVELITIPTSH